MADNDDGSDVNDDGTTNAEVLERELRWLYAVLEARLRLHFGQAAEVAAVAVAPSAAADPAVSIPAPPLEAAGGPYADVVRRHGFGPPERLVLALAVAPYLRPALLDPLFTRNGTYDRPFTEFGGTPAAAAAGGGGFVPTVETALFLLAGESLHCRLAAARLFAPEHPFQRRHLLDATAAAGGEPTATPGQRPLRPTPPLLHHLLTGEPWRPRFGAQFPARRQTTPLDWDDLVLDPETRGQVDEILAWVRHGPTLLGEWGLGRHLRPGLRCLFAGPPGTGKTLTAALLGKATGRDVYRVDLSMVVSKYIGETEKNLEAVFAQAEDRDWVLFFDEADALFGRRTQVRDAHDRYANQEVSYLLQRVEGFAGLVVLATNLRENVDDAFMRRFEVVVAFPVPGPDEVHALWQKGFSPRCPLATDVDLRLLSQRYRLTGGTVMNVVRYCSLVAVRRDPPVIRLRDVEEGIRREFRKEGRTA